MEANKRIRLKIASPCSADWSSMKGDDAVRHCGSCNKDVYQLSNMSSAQVEALLAESGTDKCVRFYQRKDGTLLTEDCFVGLRRKRRKQAVIGAGMGVLSTLGLAMSSGAPAPSSRGDVPSVEDAVADELHVEPVEPIVESVEPLAEPEFRDAEFEPLMGALVEMDFDDEHMFAELVGDDATDEP